MFILAEGPGVVWKEVTRGQQDRQGLADLVRSSDFHSRPLGATKGVWRGILVGSAIMKRILQEQMSE